MNAGWTCLCFVALAFLAGAPRIEASPLDDWLLAFNAEISALAEAERSGDASERRDESRALAAAARLQQAIARADIESARQCIVEIKSLPNLPPTFIALLEKLSSDLPELLDRREEDYAASVNDLIVRTREKALVSERDDELDPLLREASALRRQRWNANSPYLDRATAKLDALLKFLPQWQNYLAQRSAGFVPGNEGARSILTRLAGDNFGYPILPIATIQARLDDLSTSPAESSPKALIEKIKRIGDIGKVAPEITRLLERSKHQMPEHLEFLALDDLARGHAALLAGEYGTAYGAALGKGRGGNFGEMPPNLHGLYRELLLKTLPGYLELPFDVAPAEDENATGFLQRHMKSAIESGDWPLLQRLLESYGDITFSHATPEWLKRDKTALINFVAALKSEKAGQFGPALLLYQRALEAPGLYAPVDAASERLAILTREHPELSAEAVHEQGLRSLAAQLERVVEDVKMLRTKAAAPKPEGPDPRLVEAQVRRYDSMEKALQALNAEIKEQARVLERLAKLELAIPGTLGDEPPKADLAGRVAMLENLLDEFRRYLVQQATLLPTAQLWLGPDNTVYRSAVPLALEDSLTWRVSFNGKVVLRRRASKETQFKYRGNEPGDYEISLEGNFGDRSREVGDSVKYVIPENAPAAGAGTPPDEDPDRDGVSGH